MAEIVAWKRGGFDESNNGIYPSIYVLTFSNYEQDALEQAVLMPKIRRSHTTIQSKLDSRHYSFLLFTRTERDMLPYYKTQGVILSSLLVNEVVDLPFSIYIDGQMSPKSLDFTRGFLSDTTGIDRDAIKISYGKDLDRRIPLVNIADEAAHWMLRKSVQRLRTHPNIKDIPKEFLRD